MANNDAELTALKGQLKDFKVELVKALDRPADFADYADAAATLGGKTPDQISALAVAEVTKHTQKIGVNAHHLVPGDVGSYSDVEYEAKFDLLADNNGGVPLSFYGDNEFLPPAVTGSYESGSNTTPYNNVAMLMEDNGTLMILRSGTDGDSAGVYYSYLRNAMAETDLNNLVMTNVEYRPAYFPAGMRAKAILNGTQDVITGIMKDAVTGAHTGYFISLTNNTMDQTKHTGIFVPNGNFISVKGPLPGLYHIPFGFVKGNYVYILHDIHQEGKMGHRVWRLNKNDLITGVFNGATRITGWTINRGVGGTVIRDDIILFDDVASSSNNTGKPNTTVWATNGSNTPHALTRDNGNTGVFFAHYVQYYPGDNAAQITGYQWYFKYEFNENKQIDVSPYHNWKASINYSVAGWSVSESACLRTFAKTSHQDWHYGQDTSSIYSNIYNQVWLWTSTSYQSINLSMVRFTYDENLDPIEVLAGEHDYKAGARVFPVGRFGSALTTSYRAVSNVGDDVVTCLNYGRYNGVVDNFYVRSVLQGNPTFQYSSVTGNYAFKGFAPTSDRTSYNELGVTPTNFRRFLNEASPGVSKVSQARFSNWWPTETSRAANVDRNLQLSGSITVPQAVMASLQAQILGDMSARGYALSTIQPGVPMMAFEFIIPQAYTDLPPFVIGTYIHSDRALYVFCYPVNISGSRQAVTGASITGAGMMLIRANSGNTLLGLSPEQDAGQVAIRRVNGGFAIGYSDSTYYGVVGNNGHVMLTMQYTAAGFANIGHTHWDYWNGTAPGGWVNLPNRGLYWVLSSEFIYGEIDCGSKMVAAVCATDQLPVLSVPELMDRAKDPNYAIIMISQRVVSAWTVYFSDETPAMLDGYYKPVKPFNYNLNPATDGNKTFHVWLVRVGDELQYKINDTTTVAPPAPALYLGYFTTISTGLNSINIQKHVAVDGYMVSPEDRGSSIAVTSGTPNSYGRLNWK